MSDTINQDFVAFRITDDISLLKEYFDNTMGSGTSEHQDFNKVGNFLLEDEYEYGDKVVDVIEELEMEAPEIDRYEFALHDVKDEKTRESLYVIDDGDTQVLAGSDKGARRFYNMTSDTSFDQ